MKFLKKLWAEVSTLFFLGVGISGMRRIERDLELSSIPSGGSWRRTDLVAELVEHGGEPAVRLSCNDDSGLAWIDGLQFAEGEIRVDWAASHGSFGIAIDIHDEKRFKLIRFSAGETGMTPLWQVQFLSSNELAGAGKRAQPVGELTGGALDWVKLKISIHKGRMIVVVNDHNIPCLRVTDFRIESPGGSIGLWIDRNSSAFFTHLKCVEIRKHVKI